MNTKLLKQKILDLAIRGKLTQQLKSDGNTADLLKQISEQKRESSSTLSSPRRRGSPSAQSEKTIIPLDKSEAPFEIPANWEWVRLPDVCSIPITDGTHQTPTYSNKEDGIPFLSAKDVTTQKIVWDKIKYITKSLHEELCLRIAPKRNDILLAKNGTTGVAALVETDIIFDIYVTLAVLRPRKIVNPRFLLYFVNGPVAKAQFDASLKGVGVPNLHLSEINKVVLPLPPLAEQQRIVAKIEEAFAEIDAIEKNKELLKTHIKQTRQKILDFAIHGKLVPQNKSDEPASVLLERITRDNPHYEKIEDEPFEIPENWAWCRLRNLSESIQYGYNAPAKDSGRIKMVRISDIHENEVEWDSVPYCDIDDKEIQTYLLKKNDILFARTGGTVGKSFIVSNLPEDAVYAGYLIRTRYGKNANAQYMKYFMESNLYWEQLRDGCIATAQPNCNGKTLGKMQIPLPPLNEQSRIVAKIEELFSTLDQMERNLV